MFIMASHKTLGKLQSNWTRPSRSLRCLMRSCSTYPLCRQSSTMILLLWGQTDPQRFRKSMKTKMAGEGKGKPSKISICEGCTTHDAENKPLCFKFQTGKCSFKGPAGKMRQGLSQVLQAGVLSPQTIFSVQSFGLRNWWGLRSFIEFRFGRNIEATDKQHLCSYIEFSYRFIG